MKISSIKYLFFLGVVVVVLYANVFCNTKNQGNTEHSISAQYASLNDTVKYVGMNTCKQCHPGIYETFIETGMGKSFDLASHTKTAAKFEHAVIYDQFKNLHYQSYWQGDSLKFKEFRLEAGDTIYQRIETVNYIVGSGQHTNSHIFNSNGYLHQAPMTYYTQKGTWDFPPGFENGHNSRFSRKIGLECITCHNAYPKMELGSENKYTFVANGIDCERCHGPGEIHVKQKQNGQLIDTSRYIDYSIVNPAKLSIDLQMDVCQRCHIQGNTVLNKGKTFFDFRPGMPLSAVLNSFMPVYSGQEEEHIMASHAERLKMSQCFIATSEKISNNPELSKGLKPYKNALTCITCHNPHVSVKVTGKEIFNTACKNCHNTNEQKKCSENPIKLKAQNNNCVTCHMPKSGAIDIPHVRVTDHYIAKPMAKEKIKSIKTFIGLACINNPKVSNEVLGRAYINYYEKFTFETFALDSAKKYFSTANPGDIRNNFEELVHISYLKENYNEVVGYCKLVPDNLNMLNQKSYGNEDTWTCYRIGESFSKLQQPELALPYYKKAVLLSPYMLDFQNKYGTLLTQLQQTDEAKKVFRFIVNEDPENAQGWCNLGYLILTTERNADEARECYNKSLALNPDYEQAIINSAGLYAYQGDFKQARLQLNNYLKRNGSNEKVKTLLQSMQGH